MILFVLVLTNRPLVGSEWYSLFFLFLFPLFFGGGEPTIIIYSL
jgi:hypothetical protein